MAFQDFTSPVPEIWVTLGGTNGKTGKPNPTSITGYYLGRSVTPSQFDDNKDKVTFVLQTSDGIVGLNSSANMTHKMNDSELNLKRKELSPIGMKVRVQFTGTKPSGKGNPTKLFSVSFDTEDVKEVTPVNSSEPELENDYNDAGNDEDENDDLNSSNSYESEDLEAVASLRQAKVEADLKALRNKTQRKS